MKFCKVDEPLARRLASVARPPVRFPVLSDVEKRFVEEATLEKKLVEVEFVVVDCSAVKFCSVDDPVARKLVVEAYVVSSEVTVRSLVFGLKVKPASPARAVVPLQYVTWLDTPVPVWLAPPTQVDPIAKHPLVSVRP